MKLRRRTVVVIAALGAIPLLLALVMVIVITSDSKPQADPPVPAQGPPLYGHLEQLPAFADEHGPLEQAAEAYEAMDHRAIKVMLTL